jgi:hypothetical protein
MAFSELCLERTLSHWFSESIFLQDPSDACRRNAPARGKVLHVLLEFLSDELPTFVRADDAEQNVSVKMGDRHASSSFTFNILESSASKTISSDCVLVYHLQFSQTTAMTAWPLFTQIPLK